jgi:hypothetical protein
VPLVFVRRILPILCTSNCAWRLELGADLVVLCSGIAALEPTDPLWLDAMHLERSISAKAVLYPNLAPAVKRLQLACSRARAGSPTDMLARADSPLDGFVETDALGDFSGTAVLGGFLSPSFPAADLPKPS